MTASGDEALAGTLRGADLPPDWAEQVLRPLAEAGDAPVDLMLSALALASFDAPVSRLTPYLEHLDRMAAEVAEAAGPDPDGAGDRIAALNHVLFGLHGFQGDAETYDDLQNANLIRVIDRRKGLPVALGILTIHLARAQGWDMRGLDFPGHFLLRLDVEGERRIVDPFHGGADLDAPALRALLKATAGADAELEAHHYEPVTDREILLRLQNNIKLRLIRDRRVEAAVGVVDSMLLFAPDRPALWREAGLMNAHIGNVMTAVEALSAYVAREPRADIRREAETLLEELRGKLN